MIPRKGTEISIIHFSFSLQILNFLNDSPKGDGNLYGVLIVNTFFVSKFSK